jgi:hypothetical protein
VAETTEPETRSSDMCIALSSFQRTKAPPVQHRTVRDSPSHVRVPAPAFPAQQPFPLSPSFRWCPSGEPFNFTTLPRPCQPLFRFNQDFFVDDSSPSNELNPWCPELGEGRSGALTRNHRVSSMPLTEGIASSALPILRCSERAVNSAFGFTVAASRERRATRGRPLRRDRRTTCGTPANEVSASHANEVSASHARAAFPRSGLMCLASRNGNGRRGGTVEGS